MKLANAAKTRYVSPVYPAMVQTGLGDQEAAFASLEEAFRQRSGWMLFLSVEPAFDALREDRRFIELLRRVQNRGEPAGASAAAAGAAHRSTSSTP